MSVTPGPAGVFDRRGRHVRRGRRAPVRPIAAGLVGRARRRRPGSACSTSGADGGAVLAPVAHRWSDRTGRAVGLDLAPGMVRRTAADLADLDWVEVRVGDAQAPDLAPAARTTWWPSSLVLFFLDDPAAGPAALGRACWSPGGRLGVTTFGEQDPAWRDVDAVFEPDLPASPKDARDLGRPGPFGSDARRWRPCSPTPGWSTSAPPARTVDARFRDVEHLLRVHLVARPARHVGGRARGRARRRPGPDPSSGSGREPQSGPGRRGSRLSQDVRHTLARRPVVDGG